jgi:O-antigen biosynthesis protein
VSHAIRAGRPNLTGFADVMLHHALAAARTLARRSPSCGNLLRQLILLVWWAGTMQLRMQLMLWLRARRLRRTTQRSDIPMLVGDIDVRCLRMPLAGVPTVSVIIPTFGKIEYTLRCLASIMSHEPVAAIEVIVVDDCSHDPAVRCLEQVRGLRLLRNLDNLGFVRACNAAARVARGRYLLFLNNDTQVQADWLDSMLRLFETHRNVGAVGSRLLYPDGRLQEAGGIIWNDGTSWNFGRHESPDRPAYSYVREVDYCSGASLMVARSTFLELDGFDERYVPAYFEDADLCFRLRVMGLRTLYQPRSRVVHHEGTSHGRDVDVGRRSFQGANRRTFLRTWAAELAQQHYPSGTHILRARERGHDRPVILIADHMVPQPDRDAGSRSMTVFLRCFLDAGFVVKFWPQNGLYMPGYTEALQEMGIEVFHGAGEPGFERWLREHGRELDFVLLSRPEVAEAWLPRVRGATAARVIYYGHDLHFRRMRMQGDVMRDEALLRAADRMEERERAVWRDADVVLYPSTEEAAMAAALEPSVTVRAVLPYGFDRFGCVRRPPVERDILFVAGFGHPPNEDAVIWFVQAVLPLVLARVPDARLTVAGSNPTETVRALADGIVRIEANITEAGLLACYARARVAVVPLRCGAGVKMKVVEALREGVPLVTTPVGAQGLPGLDAVAWVETEAAPFADAVCTVLLDDHSWACGSEAALAYARANFRLETLATSLLEGCGFRQADAMQIAA